MRVDARALGIAKIQELRDTVADFRATGKTAVAWADTYGEAGDGNLPYYLATAFSRIVLSPTGLVGLSGLMSRATFLKGALDKLDVKFEAGARHEYKSAINQYTQTEYTPAHREAMGRIVQSMNDQIVTAVAKSRDLTEERVRELIDTAPILAREALDAGLVDQLAYRDEVYAELTKEVRDKGEDSPSPDCSSSPATTASTPPRPSRSSPTAASTSPSSPPAAASPWARAAAPRWAAP